MTYDREIIEDELAVSYEAVGHRFDEPGYAVILVTRCGPINHDPIELNKEQARLLGQWLTEFANGVYDE